VHLLQNSPLPANIGAPLPDTEIEERVREREERKVAMLAVFVSWVIILDQFKKKLHHRVGFFGSLKTIANSQLRVLDEDL